MNKNGFFSPLMVFGYPSAAKGRNEEGGAQGTKGPNEPERGKAAPAKF